MRELSVKDIIDWCDRMTLGGHSLTMEWSDGGEDFDSYTNRWQ